MSLINVRHITAPLRNKFQIGAIVILALVVLMIRWNSTLTNNTSSITQSVQRQERAQRNQALLEFLQDSATEDKGLGSSDPLVDGIVTGEYERRLKAEKQRQESSDSGSFSDIRKSLGLE